MTPVALLPLVSIASALTAFVSIKFLLGSSIARHFADHPNARSLHSAPVPRTGGLGIMAGTVVSAGVAAWGGFPVAIAIALTTVSLLDDWRGLPIAARFGTHLAAAALFLVWLEPAWPWWVSSGVVIVIVWMTNLYNFMDGSDGLAGGMTLFGFGSYAIVAFIAGRPEIACLCAGIATASAAFLVFNFHPARVFMGDSGSIPLGFLAAAIGCVGYVEGVWTIWFPPLVFSPFILDATVTILRRALRRERIWHAHRKHYYQRLVRLGWGHAPVALGAYALMGIVAGVSISALHMTPMMQILTLTAVFCAYAALATWIESCWARRSPGLAE